MSTINNISAFQSVAAPEASARPVGIGHQPSANAVPHLKVQQAAPTRRDQANLSPASLLLSQALSLPDVRADKVAAIQQALAAGTYRVSSADLADKLITTLQR